MPERFFSLVDRFEVITIFRHIAADSDALGSQFGMKMWIQDKYPNKKVYALGTSVGPSAKYFPSIDTVEDEVISSSLAIILDTANAERIDDKRWQMAEYKIKIDHHVYVESYADLEYLEENAGATCEIVGSMLQEHHEVLSCECASYLYSGIISDTLQFSIQSTTNKTMNTAAYLLSFGVDIAKVNRENFSRSYKEFQFETYIQQHATFIDGVAYIKVKKEDYAPFGLTFKEAKEKVYALGNVHEFQVWALFIEYERNEQGGILYKGSLRSQMIAINDISNRYHGGGHRLACGVKNLDDDTVQQLIYDLVERVNEKKGRV